MASSTTTNTCGRRPRNQPITDDNVPIIGSDLVQGNDVLTDAIHSTMSKAMAPETRKNYRNRIARFIEYLKEHQPEYYQRGVRVVTDEMRADVSKYYFDKKEDLIYSGLNVNFLMYYLASTDKNADGKLKSKGDIRKYRDAVSWGSKMAGEPLPSDFYQDMTRYIGAYNKKFAQAKKLGEVEEFSTDPIPLPVYRFLLRRSIETNNVFAWTWTLLQWNCMARSASIDCLAFHNFSVGLDSIIIKYDDSKADKTGEKLSEKNVYSNPLDWTMCTWLAIGIYCFLHQGNLVENERLFLKKGTKDGAGSMKYHEQVVGLVKGMEAFISPHMKFEKINPYGLRKGAATHAVSGTTAAPSIPSIARRGEWSIGSVLDVYWHFGSVGDHYLGRILCGLDPNDSSFSVLPPHWNLEDPLGNASIMKAMRSLYGPIMDGYTGRKENPSGILLRCLACIVYHSDSLRKTWVKYPGHDFSKLTILHDSLLLDDLKQLVTLQPTKGVLQAPTGIPPHIGLAVQVSEVLDTLGELVNKFGEHGDNLMLAVDAALEDRALDNGHITADRLRDILQTYRNESIEAVNSQLKSMRTEVREAILRVGQRTGGGGDDDDEVAFLAPLDDDDENEDGQAPGGDGRGGRKDMFAYGGRFYAVPENYDSFPKVNLLQGLRCWFRDQVASEDGKRVRAFRLITPKMLPGPLASQFRVNWLPIFNFLEPVKAIPRHSVLTDERIDALYVECIEFLRSRVSYLWNRGQRSNPNEFSVATWSRFTSYGQIKKFGTESDKLLLKEPTNRNKAGAAGGKRKRQLKTKNVKHPARQRATRGNDSGSGHGNDGNDSGSGGGGSTTNNIVVGGDDVLGVVGGAGETVAAAGGAAAAAGAAANDGAGHGAGLGGRSGGGRSGGSGGRGGRGGGRGSGSGRGRGSQHGRGRGSLGHGGGRDSGNLFASAFAEVDGDLPEALQHRHEEIVREDRAHEEEVQFDEEARQIREEGWASRPIPAIRNYDNLSGFHRKRMGTVIEGVLAQSVAQSPMMMQGNAAVATAANGRSIGRCCITGCIFSNMELIHRCHTCNKFIHMLCAEPINDLSEDERYCDGCVRIK